MSSFDIGACKSDIATAIATALPSYTVSADKVITQKQSTFPAIILQIGSGSSEEIGNCPKPTIRTSFSLEMVIEAYTVLEIETAFTGIKDSLFTDLSWALDNGGDYVGSYEYTLNVDQEGSDDIYTGTFMIDVISIEVY